MKESRDFTGERFIPGTGGCQMAYEHLHRYLLALPLAAGKTVLDVASGQGYGAALLARAARSVLAVELHGEALRQARETYAGENLLFLQGDALRLPLADASVDLVVAMEALEHLEDAEKLTAEIARVMRPDGLALISTPNKAEYSDARGYANPFHVKEFYREEFLALLRRHFSQVELGHQRIRAGSLICWEGGGARPQEIITRPVPERERVPAEAMYFVALCRRDPRAAMVLRESAYLDPTDGLFAEWDAARDEAQAEIRRLNSEIQALGEWGRGLEARVEKLHQTLARTEDEVHERDETIRDLQEELKTEIGKRDHLLTKLQSEFEERTQWAQDLERTVAARDAEIERVNSELERVALRLARIRHAFLYRILCRLGLLPS